MLNNIHQPIKVAIIGTGRVGASCAYALQLLGLASEIVLINANRQRAEGDTLRHCCGMFAPEVSVNPLRENAAV